MVVLLRDRIYAEIQQAIITGEFQPGQELREQVLAEKYRVSRSPIRDFLLRLEQENLITVRPRQGYLVRPVSRSDIDEILDLRLLIEPACAEEAAGRYDATLQTLNRFRGFGDTDFTDSGYVDYNALFHRTIADLAQNRRLAEATRKLTDQFERLVRTSLQSDSADSNPSVLRGARSNHRRHSGP